MRKAKEEPKDEEICPCCGEMRPYPTEPGRWRFRQHPYMWDDFGDKWPWRTVTVKPDPEGLTITEDGKKEPMNWPDNAVWRKLRCKHEHKTG